MDASRKSDDEQMALWNGTAGRSWVEAQGALDRMFKPMEDLLVKEVAARPSARVLDVGCGTGSTTLAAKRTLGSQGECVGVDISGPMVERARSRAESEALDARFLCADAALHPFEPASFDLLLSRFGVMFFPAPVQAFENLRRAARPGADLFFIAWRSPAENPFMTTAERAAAAILPSVPARDLNGPGQFAFADPERVRRILDESGWVDVEIKPIDVECAFPRADLERYVTRLGPLGRVLHDANEATKAQVLATVLPAFARYEKGEMVHFAAACWWVRAAANERRSGE